MGSQWGLREDAVTDASPSLVSFRNGNSKRGVSSNFFALLTNFKTETETGMMEGTYVGLSTCTAGEVSRERMYGTCNRRFVLFFSILLLNLSNRHLAESKNGKRRCHTTVMC